MKKEKVKNQCAIVVNIHLKSYMFQESIKSIGLKAKRLEQVGNNHGTYASFDNSGV